MSHSVEDYYKRCAVLHEKAIELHRERYKNSEKYEKHMKKALDIFVLTYV